MALTTEGTIVAETARLSFHNSHNMRGCAIVEKVSISGLFLVTEIFKIAYKKAYSSEGTASRAVICFLSTFFYDLA